MPIRNFIFTYHDLAETWAVYLNGWISLIGLCGGLVSKDQGSPAIAQQFSGAFMVGGVESKGLDRCPG